MNKTSHSLLGSFHLLTHSLATQTPILGIDLLLLTNSLPSLSLLPTPPPQAPRNTHKPLGLAPPALQRRPQIAHVLCRAPVGLDEVVESPIFVVGCAAWGVDCLVDVGVCGRERRGDLGVGGVGGGGGGGDLGGIVGVGRRVGRAVVGAGAGAGDVGALVGVVGVVVGIVGISRRRRHRGRRRGRGGRRRGGGVVDRLAGEEDDFPAVIRGHPVSVADGTRSHWSHCLETEKWFLEIVSFGVREGRGH
ncbi:hypothetical protein IWX49DRAFT_633518, partial [Phyllosticta citricarpa]